PAAVATEVKGIATPPASRQRWVILALAALAGVALGVVAFWLLPAPAAVAVVVVAAAVAAAIVASRRSRDRNDQREQEVLRASRAYLRGSVAPHAHRDAGEREPGAPGAGVP